MEPTHWYKQTPTEPLFPSLLWNKPETKATSGKLVIIGGNKSGFAKPSIAYNIAQTAGAGDIRVLLPFSLYPLLKNMPLSAFYAPGNQSGSFSQESLHAFIEQSNWADGILLAGDLSKNSETAILLEKFFTKTTSQITLTEEILHSFPSLLEAVINRPATTLFVTITQLQKIALLVDPSIVFSHTMGVLQIVEGLHKVTATVPVNILLLQDNYYIATDGKVCVTNISQYQDKFRDTLILATYASIWWLQNPNKTLEALATSAIDQVGE